MAPNEQKPGVLGTRPPTPTGGGQGANEPRVRVRSPYSDQSGGALPAWFTEEMTLGEMLDAGKRLSTGEIARLQKALYLAGYYRGTSDSNPLGRPPRWGYWDGDTKQAYQSLIGEQMGEYEGVGSGYMPAGTTRTLDELLGERMAYYAEDAKKAAAVGAGDLGTEVITTVDPATIEMAARSHAKQFLGRDLSPGEVQGIVATVSSQDFQAQVAKAQAKQGAQLGALGSVSMSGEDAGRFMMPTTVTKGPPDGSAGNATTVANGIAGAFGGMVTQGWVGPGQNGVGDPNGLEFTIAVNGQSAEMLQEWLKAQTGDGKLVEGYEVDGKRVDQAGLDQEAADQEAAPAREAAAESRLSEGSKALGVTSDASLDEILKGHGINYESAVSTDLSTLDPAHPEAMAGTHQGPIATIKGDAGKIAALLQLVDGRSSDPVFRNFAEQIASGQIVLEPGSTENRLTANQGPLENAATGLTLGARDPGLTPAGQVAMDSSRAAMDGIVGRWREGQFAGGAATGESLGALAGGSGQGASLGAMAGNWSIAGKVRYVKVKLREGAGVPDFAKVGLANADERDWKFLDAVMRNDSPDPWAWDHGGMKKGAFGIDETTYRRVAAERNITNAPTYTAEEQKRVAKAYVEDLRKRYGDDWRGIAHAWLTSTDVVDRWHASNQPVDVMGRAMRGHIDDIYTRMMSGTSAPAIDTTFGDTFGYQGEKLSQFSGGGYTVVGDVDPTARTALETERRNATEGQAYGVTQAMGDFQAFIRGG